ncbi:hypothetical protein T552_02721 [Pneumocystis carinii B80]|uniref:Flavoprotein domain-containing protein n=1 Tax=Pneumocystis carinii (strain B80) TaxID=1408658 RepID=A0A0W4ZEB8_PNEC8|nr:hypothetical protein T552_02721 [Pneumocystis carinii B80]KTW26715.1 hypothetical protein T552_02721 [Pneumocystis carinii B80]
METKYEKEKTNSQDYNSNRSENYDSTCLIAQEEEKLDKNNNSDLYQEYIENEPLNKIWSINSDIKRHILIGVTGSIAAIKLPIIIQGLLKYKNVEIQIVYTSSANQFFDLQEIKKYNIPTWTDGDEWELWKKYGDPILHIQLRRWAHLLLLIPLSANSLSKIANGICDNLLLSILRAWSPNLTIFAAPSMNTLMWQHPLTQKHIQFIQQILPHIQFINPIEKTLACGDTGMGAMAEPTEIINRVVLHLALST